MSKDSLISQQGRKIRNNMDEESDEEDFNSSSRKKGNNNRNVIPDDVIKTTNKKIVLFSKQKGNLPTKVCIVCNRPFTWRKKWERCWDEVTCCSKSCNSKRRGNNQSNIMYEN